MADLPPACFGAIAPSVVVHTTHRQVVERPYGVLDGDELRRHLGAGVERRRGLAQGVQHFTWGSRVRLAGSDDVDARLVVDAAGRGGLAGTPPPPAAWQSAYGVVLDAPPSRFDADRPTFMDLRSVGRTGGPPTFCYVVPVHDGWLVEETVLAAPGRVDAGWLADRLAARLGADAPPAAGASGRVEIVHIPMGGPLPAARQPVVPFGAAAGYTNPVTGFSVATALRAAPRVATAIADALSTAGRPDVRPIHRAVWPSSLRRTRRLHDHGLNVLIRLPANELAEFFACLLRSSRRGVVAVPARRLATERGQSGDGGPVATASLAGASPTGGNAAVAPLARRDRSECLTANTHPTMTPAEKMNHWPA